MCANSWTHGPILCLVVNCLFNFKSPNKSSVYKFNKNCNVSFNSTIQATLS
jgi:hypothetical protein